MNKNLFKQMTVDEIYDKSGQFMFVYLFGFYGISTFVGYLMPNPFLYKWTVLFQTNQFSMSIQFNCQKHFYSKLFGLVNQFYFKQFILTLVDFQCQKHFYFKQFSLAYKNGSILNNLV